MAFIPHLLCCKHCCRRAAQAKQMANIVGVTNSYYNCLLFVRSVVIIRSVSHPIKWMCSHSAILFSHILAPAQTWQMNGTHHGGADRVVTARMDFVWRWFCTFFFKVVCRHFSTFMFSHHLHVASVDEDYRKWAMEQKEYWRLVWYNYTRIDRTLRKCVLCGTCQSSTNQRDWRSSEAWSIQLCFLDIKSTTR